MCIRDRLKPGYNVQFAVNSGFITGIGVFSNRTDFGTLIPFLTYLWHKHGKSYCNVVADSGYESLANYRWLFENGQTAFIKPANYESGKKRSSKSQVGRMENMGYYEPDDCFICKNGRHLDLSSHYTSHAKDGTERKISVYRCEDCSGSVSYTHLDVYKRQAVRTSGRRSTKTTTARLSRCPPPARCWTPRCSRSCAR